MRTISVKVAGKDVAIREMKIKELTKLAKKLGVDFEKVFQADKTDDVLDVAIGLLTEKIPEIFPTLTKDDVENSYPSELEALIGGFIDTNFFGIKKAGISFLKLQQKS